MKHRLYNVIFPIWLMLFVPPILLITLIGNWVFDSLVLLACFHLFRLASLPMSFQEFYKRSIPKVWFFGLVADIVGAAILLMVVILGDTLELPVEGISYDPFGHPASVLLILLAMLVSGIIIFLLNDRITLAKIIPDEGLRRKMAITIAALTIPWTFLLPTKWFYH